VQTMKTAPLQLVTRHGAPAPASSARDRAGKAAGNSPFSRRFWCGAVDLRPLGLTRITFGLMVIYALVSVAPVLTPLLSDDGVLPRAALLGGIARSARVSIFDVAGPAWMTWTLWLAALVAAVAFVLGWRTRAATIATFLLVAGLYERNTFIFDGSDTVARVFLFWSLFLPMGATYSVDAMLARAAGRPLPATGHAFNIRLAQVQLCWIYFCTFLCKQGHDAWSNGTALHYAFGLEHLFTKPLGAMLFNASWFTVPATYGTLVFEAAFSFLVFAPFWQPRLKALALLSGLLLHLGIFATMNVGNFSFMMLSLYPLLFEPEWAAELVTPLWHTVPLPLRHAIEAAIDARVVVAVQPAPHPSRKAPWLAWSGRALLAALFAVTLFSTLPETTANRLPHALRSLVQLTEAWQRWDMFAPSPMRADRFLHAEGTLADGRVVDVLHGLDGGPTPALNTSANHRWTKYIVNLTKDTHSREHKRVLAAFGDYLCHRWRDASRDDEDLLMQLKLYESTSETPAPGETREREWEDRLLWNYKCH
jgi:hypothetical protein